MTYQRSASLLLGLVVLLSCNPATPLAEIQQEWKLNTADKLMQQDSSIYQLLTNPLYKFPTVLPDSNYRR